MPLSLSYDPKREGHPFTEKGIKKYYMPFYFKRRYFFRGNGTISHVSFSLTVCFPVAEANGARKRKLVALENTKGTIT